MNKKVIILTECGTSIGFGHLTRSVSLATDFEKHGYETKIIVDSDLKTIDCISKVEKCKWYEIPELLKPLLRACEFILIDSFIVTKNQIDEIQRYNENLVVIDDYPRRNYSSGIVIDWTIGAERYAFKKKNPEVLYLLGSSYCALRQEFQHFKERKILLEPKSILITFGGSDIRCLTPKVLQSVYSEFPNVRIDIVIGNGVKDKSYIDKFTNSSISFHLSCSAAEMKSLMESSDLAISGGGQTLYELASQGLPSIAVSIIEDQIDDIREFASIGFIEDAGLWDNPELINNINTSVKKMWSSDIRNKVSKIGRSHVDGHGANRILQKIINHFRI